MKDVAKTGSLRSNSHSFLCAASDFNLGRDRAALFSAHPDNIFQVKLNYWLSL